jgi:hypothetical protein
LYLDAQPAKLKAMHERNQAFANRLNRASYAQLAALADQYIHSPAPLKEDCGCSKKAKSAPTRPDQDQLNNEKESNL